ncbi:MAG: glucosamine-6-phosphate deaminase [Erysipelotrichaceae bacterium]|nr:glucosamine-6-phosphate deaminase [Erysipelotrichaceae bacterium]MDY5252446.1 glucosamine-6-phosphate deaminase [Erysipelotrichaceae bacterium]
MEVIICKDYEEASAKAYEVMKSVISAKEDATLGLATGSTPIGLYKNMIKDHKENGVSYAKCHTFNLDEYVGIDRNHEQSYYTFMHENLFNHIDIKEENVNLPYGDDQAACDAYEKAMDGYKVDIQVLGIGANGHIGFNEPGTSFDSLTHIVDLQEKTISDNARFFNDDMNLVPKKAITMGIATIMKAKKVLLIATGANKADAVYGLVKGEVTESLPASILQRHEDVVVVVDEAAASKIK